MLTPCGARRSPEGCDDFETCLVEVDFNKLPDKAERQRLKHLPTSFHLAAEDVDALRVTARELITSSPDFQAFMRATGGRMSSPASP